MVGKMCNPLNFMTPFPFIWFSSSSMVLFLTANANHITMFSPEHQMPQTRIYSFVEETERMRTGSVIRK